MRISRFAVIILLGILTIVSCSEKSNFIKPSNDSIQYNGRIDFSDVDKPMLTWAGSSIKIKFKGNAIAVLLQNKYGKCDLNVVIDDDSIFVLTIDSTKKMYNLASGLGDKEHTVKIFKRTNAYDFWFYGFKLDKNAKVLKLPERTKTIEFIGDSITMGSSINDTTNDDWHGLFSDNYFTYAAITARHYNARYFCIAQGGVGLMNGGNPLIMNELYYRKNMRDSMSKWGFSKVQPDIVVINLFQNDKHVYDNPDHPNFKKRYGDKRPTDDEIVNAYIAFVQKIKKNYPKAKIICSLGSMNAAESGSRWVGYVKKAVEKMNNKDIYFCLFPYKNTPGHPEVEDHRVMADTLINFIDRNNIW